MSQNSASVLLEELREKRLKWVKANRENEFEAGISNLLTELYPDQAHFIYELLQNAEDAGARRVHFELHADRLVVAHDGKRLFEFGDVDSITSIGRSTKKDDVNQIGKFGVGFKAVFSYTNTPRVYSGNFNFEIRDLVCPYPAPHAELQADQTKFEFPFNNPQKSAKACFEQIRVVLEGLADNVLLFLTSVEEVTWSVDTDEGAIVRLDHDRNILEIEYRSSKLERASSSYYLKYEKKVYVEDPKAKSTVSIAFRLAFKDKEQEYYSYKLGLSQQVRVVPEEGQLSIFFPAEKETTNLRFHIHAPFASTVARDSIPHDHMGNQRLIEGLSELLVDALADIKEQGLLTVDFLEVLPNDEDGLSKFYKPIQQAVIQAMSTQPLVPMQGDTHAPATGLLQGPADIRKTVTEDCLPFFTQRRDVSWAAGVMRNSRADRFLQSLGIEMWSWRELDTALNNLFKPNYPHQGPHSESLKWLSKQDDVWMQEFYILLADLLGQSSYRFRPSPSDWHIVRTETGKHVCGSDAYFPDKQVSFDVIPIRLANVIAFGEPRATKSSR